MERRGLQVALLLALLCAAVGTSPWLPAHRWLVTRNTSHREAGIGAGGLGTLALPASPLWGRTLTDGLLAPLADTPAGYALHPVGDAVTPPQPHRYTLQVRP